MSCLICELNSAGKFSVFTSNAWIVDLPFDIPLKGLYFIKTKRHIEHLSELNKDESKELGVLIQKYAKISKKETKAKRIITMSLGFSDPHLHFWIVPVTKDTEKELLKIKDLMKDFADRFR